MTPVAPIKLPVGPKVLWFDPNGLDIHAGDSVIVTTKRGQEFGEATSEVIEISDELVEELKSPLQPVLRIATEEDKERAANLEQQGIDAMPVFREMVEESEIEMHPVMVEFLFDGEKAVFYFESEDRVDFRELVRKLASHFHVRVDMRQIGVRDGARIIGGLGHCGQELCCKRIGGEFSPVSIRMAKEQGLSLNPQKISGVCGRLMCCLRYEYEAYKEFNARAPKLNAQIELPEGTARVTEINVPSEVITLEYDEGKTIKVPLVDFEHDEESQRPHAISEEVFAKYSNASMLDSFEVTPTTDYDVSSLQGDVKLADPTRRSRKADGTTPRKRSGARSADASDDTHRRRRRRSHTSATGASTDGVLERDPRTSRDRNTSAGDNRLGAEQGNGRNRNKNRSASTRERTNNAGRSRNNRTSSDKQKQNRQGQKQEIHTRLQDDKQEGKQEGRMARPGQRSSGLSAASASEKKASNKKSNSYRTNNKGSHGASGVGTNNSSDARNTANSSTAPSGSATSGNTHRKSRRRSHTAGSLDTKAPTVGKDQNEGK